MDEKRKKRNLILGIVAVLAALALALLPVLLRSSRPVEPDAARRWKMSPIPSWEKNRPMS